MVHLRRVELEQCIANRKRVSTSLFGNKDRLKAADEAVDEAIRNLEEAESALRAQEAVSHNSPEESDAAASGVHGSVTAASASAAN